MSKFTKKIISFVLVSAIVFIMYIPASAQDEFLGTDDDITGYIVPEDDDNRERVVKFPVQIGDGALDNYVKIFSIRAENVTTLLPSSYGGKSFYLSDLPAYADNIILIATLHHSLEDYVADGNSTWPHLDEMVQTGVCYYGYSPDVNDYAYRSICSFYLLEDELGETWKFSFSIDDYLDPYVEYFTFVKHNYYTGHVYGDVHLYYE